MAGSLLALLWVLSTNAPVEIWRTEGLENNSFVENSLVWRTTNTGPYIINPQASPGAVFTVKGGATRGFIGAADPTLPAADPFLSWSTNNVCLYPYDTSYTREDYQWYFKNTGQPSRLFKNGVYVSQETGNLDAGILEGWELLNNKGAPNIRVGIADSGCFFHKDLEGAIIAGKDFIHPGASDYSDTVNHGTMIATVIAARKDDGIGIAGVAYNANLLIARTSNLGRSGYDDITAPAIKWLIGRGVHVIYIGGGTSYFNPGLSNACYEASLRGIAMVCSAPNTPVDLDTYRDYPTWFHIPGLLTVTSANRDGTLFESSAFGTNVLVVPSRVVIGGYNSDQYAYFSGSSPGGALAVGMIALLLSEFPEMTAIDAIELLKRSATPLARTAGIINLKRAIEFRRSLN